MQKGEFLAQLATETQVYQSTVFYFKRRQQWDTGYPLITLAALKVDEESCCNQWLLPISVSLFNS